MANSRSHGPENAEHELRIAYGCTVDASTIHFWDRRPIPGVHSDEVLTLYKRAFNHHRRGNALACERWARSTKHLARALVHEAKIAYLEPHSSELPFLPHATAEELNLHEHSDTTSDLLDSLEHHVPPEMTEMPEIMKRYLSRARNHLAALETNGYTHELLRAERIKAAYEYGRVAECLALAYEAETHAPKAA